MDTEKQKVVVVSAQDSKAGLGPVEALTIMFVGLKLTDAIDWSWWWVLSPLWLVMLAGVTLLMASYLARKI